MYTVRSESIKGYVLRYICRDFKNYIDQVKVYIDRPKQCIMNSDYVDFAEIPVSTFSI